MYRTLICLLALAGTACGADSTIFDLSQESSVGADYRFALQKTSAATRATSATFALMGGLENDATYNTDANHADIAAAVGTIYLVDLSNLTSDMDFDLPTAPQIGERVGVYITDGDDTYDLVIYSGAAGDTIGGDLDCSSIAYRRLRTQGAFFVFRAITTAGDWVVDARWQGLGWADDPPDGFRPVIADDSTDNAAAIQALIDEGWPVRLPPGIIRIASVIELTAQDKSGARIEGAGPMTASGSTNQGLSVNQGATILRWDGNADEYDSMIWIKGNNATVRDMTLCGTNQASINSNPTFTSDTYTKGAGWSYDATDDNYDASSATSDLELGSVSVTNGVQYRVDFEIVAISGGSVTPSVGGTTGSSRSTTGVYSEIITAGADGTVKLEGSSFTGTVDNFYVTNEVDAGIRVARVGSLATGRSHIDNCCFYLCNKGIFCDAANQIDTDVDSTANGTTVSQTGTTVTLDGGATWNTDFRTNINSGRSSGNDLPQETITIDGNTYNIVSSPTTTTLTVDTSASHSTQAYSVNWWVEEQSAHLNINEGRFHACTSCLYVDNEQSFGHVINNLHVTSDTRKAPNVINCQGGGGVIVNGGAVVDGGSTLLTIGSGMIAGGNFQINNVLMDSQATNLTWLVDNATTRNMIHFNNCSIGNGSGAGASGVRAGAQRGSHIIFQNCILGASGWSFDTGTADAFTFLFISCSGIEYGDWTLADALVEFAGTDQDGQMNATVTLDSGDATPEVNYGNNFVVAGSTAITDFDFGSANLNTMQGMEGKTIHVQGNGSVDIVHDNDTGGAGPILLKAGSNYTALSASRIIALVYRNGIWYEL